LTWRITTTQKEEAVFPETTSTDLGLYRRVHRYGDEMPGGTRSPHLAGNLMHDAHTAILMREHGIRRICTRDTDFNQLAFLEVIDPLRS
jgi:hypothetical protein